MAKNKIKLSKISLYHYIKLVFHSLMFVAVLVLYIINRTHGLADLFEMFDYTQIVLMCMWMVFAIEMIFRFFPSKIESMGCQKIFKRNFVPYEDNSQKKPKNSSALSTFAVASAWLALNLAIGILYFVNVFDDGILILISIAYSVCDMICILFFCPFQTWFMKNKCCNTCRIYNWDYAMIVTPLVFIPNWFTYTLVALALILLIKWEIFYKIHPERFASNMNQNLRCANCQEKLCQHKKQLQGFLKKCKAFYEEKLLTIPSKLIKPKSESKEKNNNEKTTD